MDSNVAVYTQGKPVTMAAMLDTLQQADVVFVGENHDHRQGHALELAIFTGLYQRSPALALSLEMFERDVQGVVDEYLRDDITESSFLQASRPWPNYKTDYAPLVQFCKQHGLPVCAANAPRRYVNIVTRKGREALLTLPKASRTYLAPLPYSMELPEGYAKQLDEIFGVPHGSDAKPTPAGTAAAPANPVMPLPDHLKQAQGLWDATMADSILRFHRSHRGRKIMQVNGGMHSDSGYGIVARLRQADPKLKVAIVAIRPDASFPHYDTAQYNMLADFILLTSPDPKPAP